jgi:nucleotide-binding universal stress UspA family protein
LFQTILAAVDGSAHGGAVLGAAVELAERFEGRVHLYRAIEVPQDFPAAAANRPDSLVAFLQAQALAQLEALAAGHPRVQVEPPEVLHGRPWRDVLAMGERLKADLIVIGSHGFDGWDRILGTNAGAIANRSTRNVLVVHPRAEPAPLREG